MAVGLQMTTSCLLCWGIKGFKLAQWAIKLSSCQKSTCLDKQLLGYILGVEEFHHIRVARYPLRAKACIISYACVSVLTLYWREDNQIPYAKR